MRVGGIIWDAINAYDGLAVEIYFQGCYYNCKNCHNLQFQAVDGGNKVSIEALIKTLNSNKEWFDIISFLGGEPLLQDDLRKLTLKIKQCLPDKKLWLFTGADRNDIPQWCYEVFDVIKYGRYIEELRDETYELATTNQRYLRKDVDY